MKEQQAVMPREIRAALAPVVALMQQAALQQQLYQAYITATLSRLAGVPHLADVPHTYDAEVGVVTWQEPDPQEVTQPPEEAKDEQ